MYNLENCPLSDKNGSYGGQAGLKEGIIFDNKYWLVKYPKSTKSMARVEDSYTTSLIIKSSIFYKIFNFIFSFLYIFIKYSYFFRF